MDEVMAGSDGRAIQVRKARRNGMTPARRRRFLEHLAATCNVIASAKSAGLSYNTFYTLRRNDPDFAAAWEQAIQTGYDRLEEALLARALRGVAPPDFTPDAIAVELVDHSSDDRTRAAGAVSLDGKVARVDVQLALDMLNRRHLPDRKGRGGRKPASVEEVERALGAKLDSLARRLAGEAPGGAER